GKASQLAAYETFTGDANYITKDLDRYNKVTKEDIKRVFEKYVLGKHALVMSVYPKGKKELIAAPDNHVAAGDSSKVVHSHEYDNLSAREAKDNFDRSKKPSAGPGPLITPPASYIFNLTNGLKGIGVRNTEVPDAFLRFNVKC